MYIITRKNTPPTVHATLRAAIQKAVQLSDPPCWIWRLATSRLGTLKRIEVPWEDIQRTKIDGIWCIQNRPQADEREPVDGQLYFTPAGDGMQILTYHRHENEAR